jgi:iron only hydrogenase large subunit-like protein
MDKTAKDYEYIAIDGIQNCINTLREIESGALHRCFIEMSACAGSCIGGPVMEKYHRFNGLRVADYLSVKKYAGTKDFPIDDLPDDSLIKGMTE